MRDYTFPLRLNDAESRALDAVAERLHRTRADVLRLAIKLMDEHTDGARTQSGETKGAS